jgi:hypothetical protein
MNKLFHASPQRIFALDRRQRKIDFLVRGASDVGDEVAQVVLFLQFDFAMDVRHGVLFFSCSHPKFS